ncbi:MAG: FAD-linked oxidase [Rickettsiales bacterium]|nr:FAD-linked oxidase [Rickettsiales bacterium]
MDFINLKKIKSWARYYLGDYFLYQPKTVNEIKEILSKRTKLIPSGGFRSYGDSAINEGMISSKYFNKIINFDEKKGVLKAESGITINEMIKFLLPKGWFLKVTPGTKFATLGGCIASDVHGKEHHKEGCFSENLIKLKLLINKDETIELDNFSHPDLFHATCGGMGLTGFILEAEIQCKKIKSSNIIFNKKINYNIEEVFSCFEKYMSSNYSVAWLDTRKSKKDYKSVFIHGAFCEKSKLKLDNNLRFKIPFSLKVINNLSIKIFNYLYFFWNSLNKNSGKISYDNFFYPLDKIDNWYKLYGKNGFLQYQFIVPKENGKEALLEVLNYLNKVNQMSSLAVLKLHRKNNLNYMSFPLSGYSLAMDFPITKKIYLILNELDKIILKFNGKIYLTKDARLSSYFFGKFYSQFEKVLKVRKKYNIFNFSSIQSNRIGFDDR